MTNEQALRLLQLDFGVHSAATIKAAFARRCKEKHPDTRVGNGPLEFCYIGNLQKARDVLLESAAALNRACKFCKGTGKVQGAIGMQPCAACAGTGDKR
jgi:DnaJ-class molecular chaperone